MIVRIALLCLLAPIALNAQVVTISSPEEYKKHYHSGKPMVTMYSSQSCAPCRQMKPHFISAAETSTDITFAVVDTGIKGLSELASGIRGLPTLIFSHNGTQVDRELGGMSRKELDTSINKFRSKVGSKAPQPKTVTQKQTPVQKKSS